MQHVMTEVPRGGADVAGRSAGGHCGCAFTAAGDAGGLGVDGWTSSAGSLRSAAEEWQEDELQYVGVGLVGRCAPKVEQTVARAGAGGAATVEAAAAARGAASSGQGHCCDGVRVPLARLLAAAMVHGRPGPGAGDAACCMVVMADEGLEGQRLLGEQEQGRVDAQQQDQQQAQPGMAPHGDERATSMEGASPSQPEAAATGEEGPDACGGPPITHGDFGSVEACWLMTLAGGSEPGAAGAYAAGPSSDVFRMGAAAVGAGFPQQHPLLLVNPDGSVAVLQAPPPTAGEAAAAAVQPASDIVDPSDLRLQRALVAADVEYAARVAAASGVAVRGGAADGEGEGRPPWARVGAEVEYAARVAAATGRAGQGEERPPWARVGADVEDSARVRAASGGAAAGAGRFGADGKERPPWARVGDGGPGGVDGGEVVECSGDAGGVGGRGGGMGDEQRTGGAAAGTGSGSGGDVGASGDDFAERLRKADEKYRRAAWGQQ